MPNDLRHPQHAISNVLFIHTIGIKGSKNISSSFQKDGILPHIHCNTKRLPWNSISLSSIENVKSILVNYRRKWLAPSWSQSRLLPSSKSKKAIWKLHEMATNSSDGIHAVVYGTFCQLCRALLPSIIIMRPMSDLCWLVLAMSTEQYNNFTFC